MNSLLIDNDQANEADRVTAAVFVPNWLQQLPYHGNSDDKWTRIQRKIRSDQKLSSSAMIELRVRCTLVAAALELE